MDNFAGVAFVCIVLIGSLIGWGCFLFDLLPRIADRRKWPLLLLCFAMPASLSSQTVTVMATRLGGTTPITGTITFTPTLTNGTPASFQMGGGGQTAAQPITVPVTAGAFSVTLPDVSLGNPQNVCYAVTVAAQGKTMLGGGYKCVQPHGTAVNSGDWCQANVCNFDHYTPNLTAQPLMYVAPPAAQIMLTDAATVTLANANRLYSAFTLPLNASIPARTLNVTGLTAGNTFAVVISPPYPVTIPVTTTLASWTANTSVTVGQVLWDENGHLQEVSTAGYTGATEPTWNTAGAYTAESGGSGPPNAVWRDMGAPLSVTFGTGCAWWPAVGSGLSSLAGGIVIPPGTTKPVILAVAYDGTNCNVSEVQ
jgi:hypothetical protein